MKGDLGLHIQKSITHLLHCGILYFCLLQNVGASRPNNTYTGYDPNFDIHFHKSPSWVFGSHPFQGVCTGSPGINGTLALEISNLYYGTRNIIASYVLPRDYLPMREKKQPAVRIAVEPETGLLKRRGIERIFRFKICATGAVHKARVDCVVRPTINTSVHLTAGHEDRIRVLFLVTTLPIFKVYYHLNPNVAIYGEKLVMGCSGHVGTNGSQVYWLSLEGKLFHWRVARHIDDATGFDVHIKFKEEMSDNGPRIDSTLEIMVTWEINGGMFGCYTKDMYGKTFGLRESERNKTTNSSLVVINLPHKPILEVYKYETSNPRHWILQGTCKTQANSTESIALVFRNGFRTFLHFIRPGTTEVEDAKMDDETFVNDDNLITYKVLSEENHMWLIAHFKGQLKDPMEHTTVACIVKDIQVCQAFQMKSLPQLGRLQGAPDKHKAHSTKMKIVSVLGLTIAATVGVLLSMILVLSAVLFFFNDLEEKREEQERLRLEEIRNTRMLRRKEKA